MGFTMPLRVFLAGHFVAMVTNIVTKMITTCSSVIGQFFDTMTVASDYSLHCSPPSCITISNKLIGVVCKEINMG